MSDQDHVGSTPAFAYRHSAWLTARASLATPPTGCSNEKLNQLLVAEAESLRVMMQTPATAPWMVWRKLDAFETELSGDDEGGNGILAECTMLWACIKADLMRLGIKG